MPAPKDDRDGVIQTFNALAEAGWGTASVWDGEEEIAASTAEEAADMVMDLDQAHLYVSKEGQDDGWVFFVLGNDPDEVINDHTVNLSDVLDPLTEGWFER